MDRPIRSGRDGRAELGGDRLARLDLPPPDALDNLLGTRDFGVLIESAVKPTTSGNSGSYSSRR
jgi:hypothetical protein